MSFNPKNYPGWLPWLFTLSFILITFLPRSVDDAMFMDGVTYAAISRNMSEGIAHSGGRFSRIHSGCPMITVLTFPGIRRCNSGCNPFFSGFLGTHLR